MAYKSKKLKETTDFKTWKRIQLSKVLGCPICGPNSGCNKRNKHTDNRCWKTNRKTQYKQNEQLFKRG